MLAGLNAALRAQEKDAWCPERDQAYIGVLADDLITLGTKEPYRMFTSRAEYRLMLREDNADTRLTEKGRELGLVDDARWAHFCRKQEALEAETTRLRSTWIQAGSPAALQLEPKLTSPLGHEYSLMDLLKRPEITYADLAEVSGPSVEDPLVAEQLEIRAKYAGYIDRQQGEVDRLRASEATIIPAEFDYSQVSGLSNELKQKLQAARPDTIARALRIQGMTPAAISLLLITLKKQGFLKAKRAAQEC